MSDVVLIGGTSYETHAALAARLLAELHPPATTSHAADRVGKMAGKVGAPRDLVRPHPLIAHLLAGVAPGSSMVCSRRFANLSGWIGESSQPAAGPARASLAQGPQCETSPPCQRPIQ